MNAFQTSALSVFLQVANIFLGGFGSSKNCFTSSRPSPLLAPVIKIFCGAISPPVTNTAVFLSACVKGTDMS